MPSLHPHALPPATARRHVERRLSFAILALTVAAGAGIALVAIFGDAALLRAVAASPWVAAHQPFLRFATDAGLFVFYGVFAAIGLYAWRRHSRFHGRVVQGYLLAQLIGPILIVRVLKTVLGHARPDLTQDGAAVVDWIGTSFDPHFNSFPSGHTADVFTGAVFAMIAVRSWTVRIAALLFALFMGFTRVAVAAHYPADVTASVIVAGLVSTAVIHFWLLPRVAAEDAGLRPVAERGGNGRD